MKSLHFVFVGKPKDKNTQHLEDAYLEKIAHFLPVEKHIILDSKKTEPNVRKTDETRSILNITKKNDVVIVCDEHGKNYTSKAFSEKLVAWREAGPRVLFIVGGAFGLDIKMINTPHIIRLSDMTLPHELARVVLCEQVYRTLTILKGMKYHHE